MGFEPRGGGATGRLEAIWLKRARRGPMDPVEVAELVRGRGLAGNANQGGRRQATILQKEAWDDMMEELGASVSPAARRAKLMVSGLDLERSSGALVRIGQAVLEVVGETRPCEQMDEALPGLRAAMEPRWRGGVYTVVREGGRIAVGASVTVVAPAGGEAPPR